MCASKTNPRIRLISRSDLDREIRDFLIDRQARSLSPRTVSWYREKLDIVQSHLATLDITSVIDIRSTTIRAMLVALSDTHNPGGVHGIYRALRAFINWWELETKPQRWSNPISKVHPPRVDEPPLEPVSLDDLRAMLATRCPLAHPSEPVFAVFLGLCGRLGSNDAHARHQPPGVGSISV